MLPVIRVTMEVHYGKNEDAVGLGMKRIAHASNRFQTIAKTSSPERV
jgi:hypothetical protein